ncbi:hypothetical protein WR25_16405 [Diploscapter pachys]|uniref:Uncharacterized protein n=1 Tax=Diploscapter pachys TaxID=2018661 RepID=A0A2A2L897_9BILA|nr:hypothetical protein WR25_16405 [Diploscapter pachys]
MAEVVDDGVDPITAEEAEQIEEIADDASTKKKNKKYVKFIEVPDSPIIVILLGWAGCRDRYLEKYAQIYQNAGFSSARYIVPVMKVRSYETYRTFAKRFYEEKHKAKATQCVIFSAPAFTTPLQTANALATASYGPGNSIRKEVTKAFIFTGFSFHRGVSWLRSLFDADVYAKTYAYYHLLSIKDLPKNHLYIYGPADTICTEDSIEAFIEEMEGQGMEIKKLRLEESLHCQHLRAHPELYANTCAEFVKNVCQNTN